MAGKSTPYYRLLILLFITLLWGCDRAPNDEQLRRQIGARVLQNEQAELFSLENFHKMNGFKRDDGSYIAQVSYDLVFRKSAEEWAEELEQNASSAPLAALGHSVAFMGQVMQYGNFKAGQRITREEKYRLVKTEQGWRLADEFESPLK
ncbi:MAG: hypothetical protein JXR59_00395 [Desulfuromonadaceae bacterium]|nr:hypothetical protein [Desulfuromonadaceae bacterium]